MFDSRASCWGSRPLQFLIVTTAHAELWPVWGLLTFASFQVVLSVSVPAEAVTHIHRMNQHKREFREHLLFPFLDGGFPYDPNPTQFQAQAQTGNHPQQPPPPYSKNPYPQPYNNKPQYPGGYAVNPAPNQMPNPGLKNAMMQRQQYISPVQLIRKQQQNPTSNMMASMMGAAGFNNKPGFPNQVCAYHSHF